MVAPGALLVIFTCAFPVFTVWCNWVLLIDGAGTEVCSS